MGVWYRAGTVAVTSGSKTVTGTGTQWQNLIFGVAPGVTFYGPDGKPYEIDTVNSNTSLTLVTNYSGTTASGQGYAIDPTRSGSVASLAAQTSEVLKFSQGQFTQIQNWFTGAASANVTLTSPAGQTITVPSYSKVTSEGEGQAARAKTEADKAAASAALAGDIVAASALPLPDVWAPLSDSLRMITGYGREVKVGEDVVARMVDFSRNTTATYIGKDGLLKTAAVNKPRFEKEGLLIEGQSVNLITSSNSLPLGKLGAGVSPVATAGQLDPMGGTSAVKVTLSRTEPGQSNRSFIGSGGYPTPVLDRTAVNTMSVWLRAISPTPVTLQMRIAGVTSIITVTSEWKRFSLTRPANHGDPVDGTVYFACLQDDSLLSADIVYFGGQLEQLPFASSYIPTNGAAVTRAAEIINIPTSGNFPWNGVASSGELTIAFNVKAAGDLPPAGVMNIVSFEGQYSYNGLRLRDVFGKTYFSPLISGFDTNETSIPVNPKINNLVGVRITPTKVSVFANGGIKEGVGTLNQVIGTLIGLGTGADGRILYGHIRNLRIWHKFLTDEQIKALK